MRRYSNFTRIAIALLILLTCKLSLGANNPSIRWAILETENFKIIYDSQHPELAKSYANYAETAFQILKPLFKEAPSGTTVFLDDSTDLANGSATHFPYPLINIYPVFPSDLDSIGIYGNWGLELMIHEYTHILNFEPTDSFYRPLRYILGSIVRPNGLLPRWYSEGLAVATESHFSSKGRLRSPYYQAMLRALAQDRQLTSVSIEEANEVSIPTWPGGQRPYFYGALLWQEILHKHGMEVSYTLNKAYARRLPYLINGPIQDIDGKSYPSLLAEVLQKYQAWSEQHFAKLNSSLTLKAQSANETSIFSHGPKISPNGQMLAFIARKDNTTGEIRLAKRQANGQFDIAQAKVLTTGTNIQRISWFHDSQRLVYNSAENTTLYNLYSDLFIYDLRTGKTKQITFEERARDAVVMANDKQLIFVRNQAGTNELVLWNLENNSSEILYQSILHHRLAHPTLTQNAEVIFSERNTQGEEFLFQFNVQTKKVTTLLPDHTSVRMAHMTKQGLLFISDQSGIPNVYLAEKSQKQKETLQPKALPLTNSLTAVLNAEIDKQTNTLILSQITSQGPKLFLHELAPQKIKALPKIDLMGEYFTQAPYQTKLIEAQFTQKEYSPGSYLWPRYLLPYAYIIPEGMLFQFSTGATDPIGRNSYSIETSIDTLTNKPSIAGFYKYSPSHRQYSLLASKTEFYYYGLDLISQNQNVILSFAQAFSPKIYKWNLGATLESRSTSLGTNSIRRAGGGGFVSYNNVSTARGYDISPMSGQSLRLATTSFSPDLGNRAYETTSLTGTLYLSRFLPKRNALAIKGFANYAPNNPSSLIDIPTNLGIPLASMTSSPFLMRGYLSGAFRGKNVANLTTEYRFPLSAPELGWGTLPLFIKRLHAAIIWDGCTLDGQAYSLNNGRYISTQFGKQFYQGYGLELNIDATIAYHMPIRFQYGAYYGSNLDNLGGFNFYAGFSL